MPALTSIAFLLGVVAYTASGTLFFVDLVRREGATFAAVWAPRALWTGTGLHAVHLVAASVLTNTCPVASLPFALSMSALMTSLAFLLVRRRAGIHAMGVAVAPLALTFLVGAQFVNGSSAPPEISRTLLAFHIAANILGLGLFLLAGAAGGFYLLQERRLKTKHRTLPLGRLPALDMLDSAEHRLLLAGFPLMTFGVVTGAEFMSSMVHWSVGEILKIALAYLSWFLVAGVLVLRAVAGWRGRKSAYGTLAGVVCVLLVIAAYVVRAGSGPA
jgi:ABC-type uncharacterized transport system permease subunit